MKYHVDYSRIETAALRTESELKDDIRTDLLNRVRTPASLNTKHTQMQCTFSLTQALNTISSNTKHVPGPGQMLFGDSDTCEQKTFERVPRPTYLIILT